MNSLRCLPRALRQSQIPCARLLGRFLGAFFSHTRGWHYSVSFHEAAALSQSLLEIFSASASVMQFDKRKFQAVQNFQLTINRPDDKTFNHFRACLAMSTANARKKPMNVVDKPMTSQTPFTLTEPTSLTNSCDDFHSCHFIHDDNSREVAVAEKAFTKCHVWGRFDRFVVVIRHFLLLFISFIATAEIFPALFVSNHVWNYRNQYSQYSIKSAFFFFPRFDIYLSISNNNLNRRLLCKD